MFKLVTVPDKENALLAIPEACADKIIELYHTTLFTEHQGVIKTYLTISNKFFILHLMHYLRSFLSACHICQLFRNDKPHSRQVETRINLNYRPMSRLSMDLKVMPRLQKGHQYILCVIDEMTSYLITAPLYQARSEKIGEALIENIISKFGNTRIHDNGSGQCIYVHFNELLVQEIGNQCQNSRPLQSQVITSRTWHKITVKYTDQTFEKSGTNMAQISVALATFTYNIFHTS